MNENNHSKEEVLTKVMRAGRRTYFFDVRSTRADDYYLTVTESKKHTRPDGSSYYKKHKIHLYKEDFIEFRDSLNELTDYIIAEKGEEVITDTPFVSQETTSQSKPQGADLKETSDQEDRFTDVRIEEL